MKSIPKIEMKKAKPSPKLNYLFRKKSVKAAIYNKSEDKTPNEFNASCNSSKLFEANRSLINGRDNLFINLSFANNK